MIQKISKLFLLAGLFSSVSVSSQAAISITIASPNPTSGLIYDSVQAIVTSGFARVGKITGTIDLTKVAPTFDNYSYWDSIFVDVNDTAGGGGSTPSTWNFNSSGALSGSSTGVSAATFTSGTQLYLWAFKVSGKTLTSGSAGSNGIPALAASDFTAGVEWALLTADEWIAPADLGTRSVVINQIAATDTKLSPIIGLDLGASVAMIPEPSTGTLTILGLSLVAAFRRKERSSSHA
jgi:hypothetical protein